MNARPMLFSGPMIRALLDGRKTQTRRVVKLPHTNPLGVWEPTTFGPGTDMRGVEYAEQVSIWHTRTGDVICCPYGKPGDLLWVREAWAVGKRYDEKAPRELPPRAMTVVYESGGSCANDDQDGWVGDTWPKVGEKPDWVGRWRRGFHMPRWASRLTLRITEVRVQRLQDIGQGDACAEGCPAFTEPYDWYQGLWNEINGDGSWELNPWVWAISFDVIKQNVDDVLRMQKAA